MIPQSILQVQGKRMRGPVTEKSRERIKTYNMRKNEKVNLTSETETPREFGVSGHRRLHQGPEKYKG